MVCMLHFSALQMGFFHLALKWEVVGVMAMCHPPMCVLTVSCNVLSKALACHFWKMQLVVFVYAKSLVWFRHVNMASFTDCNVILLDAWIHHKEALLECGVQYHGFVHQGPEWNFCPTPHWELTPSSLMRCKHPFVPGTQPNWVHRSTYRLGACLFLSKCTYIELSFWIANSLW